MKQKSISLLLALLMMFSLLSACSIATVDGAGKEVEDTITNFTDADNRYVRMVKGGYRSDDPDTTYEDAFTAFFGTPRWKYFESEDGQDVVEFTGDCTYRDTPVKARIQFVVDEENGTFEATYLAFNEVPQDLLTLSAVIVKAFEAVEKPADSTTGVTSTSANGPANITDAMKIYKEWEATHPLGPDFVVNPGYDDVDNNAFTLFLYGYEAELGTIYVSKTDGSMKVVSDFIEYDLDDWYEGFTLTTDDYDAYDAYVGSWGDRRGQRCHMDIESYGGISYSIDINWSSSAQENTHWSFSGTYEGGRIHYYGSKIEEYYPDNGDMQETYSYYAGEGFLWIGDDGLLYWSDYIEDAGSNCEFEKIQ